MTDEKDERMAAGGAFSSFTPARRSSFNPKTVPQDEASPAPILSPSAQFQPA